MESYYFTILVRTYNSIKVIHDSVKSLEEQTYKNFEVLFVDDGSTDGTLEFLRNTSFSFKFKIITQVHSGPLFSEIAGFNDCDKEGYLLLLDSDDMFFDYTLKTINELINAHNSDILFFNYRPFKKDINGNIIEMNSKNLSLKPNYSDIVPFVMDCFKYHYEAPLTAWNHAIKASLLSNLLLDNSFKEIVVGEELIVSFLYLLRAKIVQYSTDDLYLYRSNNPLSVTKHRKPFIDRYNFIFIGLEKVVEIIEESNLFDSDQLLFINKIILNDYFYDMLSETRSIGYSLFKKYAKQLSNNVLFNKIYKSRNEASNYVKKVVLSIRFKLFIFAYIRITFHHLFKKRSAY